LRPILTPDAPTPVGPYSQAVISGNIVIVSGQIPLYSHTGNMPDGIEEQTHLVLCNLKAILRTAGVKDGNILQTTLYISNMDDFDIINGIYKEEFAEPYPARTCIGVNALPKGSKIMVDAIGSIE